MHEHVCAPMCIRRYRLDTVLINNLAESSSSARIPLLYLGLLGDANSHFFVAHRGPICCVLMAETVITLQVSNLVKQISNPLNEFVFRCRCVAHPALSLY